VRLVTDPTQDTRDRYARLLAYVFKPGRSGPTGSVNFSLVASGHAKVYVYGGVRFRYAVPFFKAQHRAKVAKRGLWGPPCRGNTKKLDPSQLALEAPPTPVPAPEPTEPRTGCDPSYTGACIPPYPPTSTAGRSPTGTSEASARIPTTSTLTTMESPARSEICDAHRPDPPRPARYADGERRGRRLRRGHGCVSAIDGDEHGECGDRVGTDDDRSAFNGCGRDDRSGVAVGWNRLRPGG
jgi:hypothetical protein